jgi:hypothetical protein
MFVPQMARKAGCSNSFLLKAIRDKKIKAELVKKKSGRPAFDVTSSLEEVRAIVPARAGYKKNGQSIPRTKGSNLLAELIEWKSIPSKNRQILLNIGKHSLAELRIIQELLK